MIKVNDATRQPTRRKRFLDMPSDTPAYRDPGRISAGGCLVMHMLG
jgi:hypothetical protein